jgi:hypothetical protein
MSGVGEDRQISLKRQLVEFRDSQSTEMAFPSTLTNLERKFIHGTATELGLASNSAGKSDARFITVQKKEVNNLSAQNRPIEWGLATKTLQALTQVDVQAAINELKEVTDVESAKNPVHHVKHRHGIHKLHDVRHQLAQSHQAAEERRRKHRDYGSIRQKRHTLPAAHHRLAVCNMVQDHQIVLISGETGNVRHYVQFQPLFNIYYYT